MSRTSALDQRSPVTNPILAPNASASIGAMLKINQVAARLNCSVRTVYQLVESKRLPHYRCPGIRISEDQLNEYLSSCRCDITPQFLRPLSRVQFKHRRH
jgi:excisionase family DNA binding protein